MDLEGAAAVALVSFAVLSSLVALAVSLGTNRYRLARVVDDVQKHLDEATGVQVKLAEVLVELRYIRETIAELKAKP